MADNGSKATWCLLAGRAGVSAMGWAAGAGSGGSDQMVLVLSLQMEDGHSLFDYSVGLNDIVQLLVRQSPAVLPAGSKEKDSELSDTDSGCGSGPSESDKSSHNGEGALELEGQPSTAAQPHWTDPCFGLYKVGPRSPRVPGPTPCQGNCSLRWGIAENLSYPNCVGSSFLPLKPSNKKDKNTNQPTNQFNVICCRSKCLFFFILSFELKLQYVN